MPQRGVYYSNKRKERGRKGLGFWETVLAALAAAGIAWLVRWLYLTVCAPKLLLTDEIKFGSQGVRWAIEDHFYIENIGKRAAKAVFIELSIFKPYDIYIGKGLFFNDKIGHVEKAPVMDFLTVDDPSKPQIYHYRLNSHVFINPGTKDRLWIMHIIRPAFPEDAPENLDIDIEWKASCPDCSPASGRITRVGADLKQTLLRARFPNLLERRIRSNDSSF